MSGYEPACSPLPAQHGEGRASCGLGKIISNHLISGTTFNLEVSLLDLVCDIEILDIHVPCALS